MNEVPLYTSQEDAAVADVLHLSGARLGVVSFQIGNRGSFPRTVTGPPLVTAGQAHKE